VRRSIYLTHLPIGTLLELRAGPFLELLRQLIYTIGTYSFRLPSSSSCSAQADAWCFHSLQFARWGFLEVSVNSRIPLASHRLRNTLVKVAVDQGIGAPCYIYTYYVITNFLQDWNVQRKKEEGAKSFFVVVEETHDRASEMLFPTMLRHWTLWPWVHSLNFYYNPIHHRVLVQNLVLIGWSGCKS
jgi:hypothetical protein